MIVVTMNSEQARQNWQELLEKTHHSDTEVVIEQQEQPVAVLISYEKWRQLQTEPEQLSGQPQPIVVDPNMVLGQTKMEDEQAVTLDELFAHIKATRPFTQADLDRAGEALQQISHDPAVRQAVMHDMERLKG